METMHSRVFALWSVQRVGLRKIHRTLSGASAATTTGFNKRIADLGDEGAEMINQCSGPALGTHWKWLANNCPASHQVRGGYGR